MGRNGRTDDPRASTSKHARGSVRAVGLASFAIPIACALVEPCDGAEPSVLPSVERAAAIATVNGFVENKGQWPAEVLYFARAGGIEATLVADAIVLRPMSDPETGRWPMPVILHLPGRCEVEGEAPLPTLHHFFRGSGSTSNVRGFDQVEYLDVVPGIDLLLRIAKDAATGKDVFVYDLLVAPGARLEDFVISVEGAIGPPIAKDDALTLHTSVGPLEQRIGAAWQTDPATGVSESVASRFQVRHDEPAIVDRVPNAVRFGFEAPGRDPARPFVLDPGLVFSTFVGGTGQELFKAMDVDAAGATYLICRSAVATPTTPGALQQVAGGGVDAWAGKLSPDGKSLIFGTYLGGSMTEEPVGIEVDHDGTIVVAGSTWSPDFPTTNGALQTVFGGIVTMYADLFISRLDPSSGSLLWSTYYGGSEFETADALALFPNGDVLVAGENTSADPPATLGAFDPVFNPFDRSLLRVSANGTTRIFQTYFQASHVSDIEIDIDENIYFAGYVQTQFHTLPATPGAFKTALAIGDVADGFVAKLHGDGSALWWATYLGGDTKVDSLWGLAIDAASAVYVGGQTASTDLPTTPGAFDSSKNSNGYDGFVTKLLPGGTGLVWSTYFGACCGQGGGSVTSLAVDAAGNVTAVGSSNNPILPVTFDAFQPNFKGSFPSSDAYLTKFNSLGESLVYSTWFGGSAVDFTARVGLDGLQRPHLAVHTSSTNFPTTAGAYDTSYGGSNDIGVAAFALDPLPWSVLAGGLSGAVDTPNLAGSGVLAQGSWNSIGVRGAVPSSFALLIVGTTRLDLPALGGTLVPAPDLVVPLTTSGIGRIDLAFIWPVIPAGIDAYLQFWIEDAGAPIGWSATNALKLTSK